MSCNVGGGGDRCLASLDSDLEAFTRNPTAGSFTVSATYATQHLQSLDPNRSPAKDLSLQTQDIDIHQTFFTVQTGSHATGPRPNACLVTSAVVDIAA